MTFGGDWLRPHDWMGPNSALTEPQVVPTISPNDVLFGLVAATCPSCLDVKYYWVYFVVDQGGWYAEMLGQKPKVGEKVDFNPNDFEKIPLTSRIAIQDF